MEETAAQQDFKRYILKLLTTIGVNIDPNDAIAVQSLIRKNEQNLAEDGAGCQSNVFIRFLNRKRCVSLCSIDPLTRTAHRVVE